MTDSSLVSIIVITYNSSNYIIETLDSIKHQTYKNIELIISDDCSSDNTINLCQEWICKNKERFVRTELIATKKNTGIAPNCNRGIRASKGKWMKIIAGDDLLLEDCVKINIEATEKTNNSFNFSKFQVETSDLALKNKIQNGYEKKFIYFNGNQLDNLINFGYYFPTITFFANRELINKLGNYNESYPFFEDLPMWFKILKSGYTFNFINEYTAIYRVHGDSISYNKRTKINKKMHLSIKHFFYKEMIFELYARKKYLMIWDKILQYIYLDLVILLGNNKNGIINSFCMLLMGFSPLFILRKIRNIH